MPKLNIKKDPENIIPIAFIVFLTVLLLLVFTADGHSSEKESVEYSRKLFGHGWTDIDKDGENSREEILILRDTNQDGRQNKVWFLPYSGKLLVGDSSIIDIDHVVPLKEAFSSGALEWTEEKREAFANDLVNLEITHRSVNRSKGSRRPDEWMPPSKGYHCTYLFRWNLVKTTYGLSMTPSEAEFVESGLNECIQNGTILITDN